MKRRRRCPGQGPDGGQSLTEMAVFLPVLLLIIAGLVEISHLLLTQARVETAARNAARFGADGGSDNGMRLVVLNAVTHTLDIDPRRWDMFALHGTVNVSGTGFTPASWSFDHVYGAGQTQQFSGIDEASVQSEILDNLQIQGAPGGQATAAGTEIAGMLLLHDVPAVLGLDVFLTGFYTARGFAVMRRAPAIVANTTVPCSAFPIAVERTPRSISPGDYPAPGTFQYPSSAPSYASFKDHMPDRELENDAPEGSLFRYDNSGPQPEFRWLQWDGNDGDAALSASLSWPGNSETYENPTVPAGDDPYPGLNAGDAASADVVRLNQALATPGPDPLARLAEHIDRQRTLRLIVWDRTMANPYPDTVKVQGFAIMRLAGYQLDASSDTWLLLELVRWDTSCGQAPAPNA